jgi:hypothetical protein
LFWASVPIKITKGNTGSENKAIPASTIAKETAYEKNNLTETHFTTIFFSKKIL